jgi:hypothetical protein
LFHRGGGAIHQTDQKSVATLSKKEIYYKMAVRLDLIESKYLSYRGCIDTLSCCKMLADNIYEIFIRKIKNDPNT